MTNIQIKRILDSTLREGEQTPNVYFTPEEKANIAKMLIETIGQKLYLELGIVYNDFYRQGVEYTLRYLDELGLKANTLVHSRAIKEDIDISFKSGSWGVVIYLPGSDTHLKYKFKDKSFDWVLKTINHTVTYAKEELGFNFVAYTLEDATSISLDRILKAADTAFSAGADVVRLPDTKGQTEPWSLYEMIQTVVDHTGGEIDLHLHNDLGLAIANSIAGLKAGATGVHTSIKGLGERVGITDLVTFIEVLENLYSIKTGVNFKKLYPLYQYVSACTGMPIAKDHPVLGINARTHKAGVHQQAVLNELETTGKVHTYETIDFSKYSLQREFEFGAMQSKELTKLYLKRMNVKISENEIQTITESVRQMSMDIGRPLAPIEVNQIFEDALGKEIPVKTKDIVNVLVELNVNTNIDETVLIKKIRQIVTSNSAHCDILEVTGQTDFFIYIKNARNINKIISDIEHISGISDSRVNVVLGEY